MIEDKTLQPPTTSRLCCWVRESVTHTETHIAFRALLGVHMPTGTLISSNTVCYRVVLLEFVQGCSWKLHDRRNARETL